MVGGITSTGITGEYNSAATQSDIQIAQKSQFSNAQTMIVQEELSSVGTSISSQADIEKAVEKVSGMLSSLDLSLEYEWHEGSHRMGIKVVNKEDGKVIKEIPSEKILNLAADMCERIGMFLDEKR